MISENIKRARTEKGIRQEEMAVRLHVVRQTVSKWETGRSVPDAEMLLQIAELLEIPVNRLLDAEPERETVQSLTEKLAERDAELAKREKREQLLAQANRKRGLMVLLSFSVMLASAIIKDERIAIPLIFCCMLASLIVLYRNLPLLTAATAEKPKLKPLRLTTVFDFAVLAAAGAVIALRQSGRIAISSDAERWIAAGIAGVLMLFGGYIAPKLPYNRHTGLRLPWTVRDEETWNVAHRALGYFSAPCVLLNLAANMTSARSQSVSAAAFVLWITVPSVLSGIWFLRKYYKKRV